MNNTTRFIAGALLALIACGFAVAANDPPKCQTRLASVAPEQIKKPTKELGSSRDTPADELTLVLYCMTVLAQGNFQSAQMSCGRAILLDPADPSPYKLRGVSYLFEGRFEQARYDFEQTVRLDPGDPESHAGYAEALRGQNDFEGAIKEFSAAIHLSPDNAKLWNARCWTRGLFARQLEQGLTDCGQALRLEPNLASALDSRGLIHLRRGQLSSAIRDYDDALAIQHDLFTAYYGRGVARLRGGDLNGARADLVYARKINPDVDIIFATHPLIPYDCRPAMTGKSRSADWLCRRTRAPKSRNRPGISNQSVELERFKDIKISVALNVFVR